MHASAQRHRIPKTAKVITGRRVDPWRAKMVLTHPAATTKQSVSYAVAAERADALGPSARSSPTGLGIASQQTASHLVPALAYLATCSTLELSMNAGPVRVAPPPPMTFALFSSNQSASTAR